MDREYINLTINGKKQSISGERAFVNLSEYLRREKGLTGTKIVCAEGDCGSCSVLVRKGDDSFKAINSCIVYPYLLDGYDVVTVEGVGSSEDPSEVQKCMVEKQGSQCGYCTPGFITALTQLTEEHDNIDEKKVKNYLTGNLCRCTGYQPIINAALAVDLSKEKKLNERIAFEKLNEHQDDIIISNGDVELFLPKNLDKALEYLKKNDDARIVSGATDLGVVHNKGKLKLKKVLSLANINELEFCQEEKDGVRIGANVCLTDVGKLCESHFPEFSRMLHIFASPQIKNFGKLIGNVVNASPIADTIPFLMVADAVLSLQSTNGVREVNINAFYKGYKQLDLQKDEIVTSLFIPYTKDTFKLHKVSARKDLDISAVTLAVRDGVDKAIAVGGVAATVVRLKELENSLMGKEFSEENLDFSKLDALISPLSDLRGSKEFRLTLVKNLLLKTAHEISGGSW